MKPGEDLCEAVAEALEVPVSGAEPVGGGSINDALRLELEEGGGVFLKTRPDAGGNEFAAEAAGLAWLAAADAVLVPGLLALGEEPQPWLALEWIEPGRLSDEGAEELGRDLARLHQAGAEHHGALPPGAPDAVLRVGPIELDLARLPGNAAGQSSSGPAPAVGTESTRDLDRAAVSDGADLWPVGPPAGPGWPRFYAERLILPVLAMARDRGVVDAAGAEAVERLCERIDDLAGPPEPPARLHGDLWSGNVHADQRGRGWLIDPAAYGGHREIDLAMLDLFGSPGGGRILAAYEEVHPLAPDHRKRLDLWKLFPLLVHAALFGGGYGSRAASAASRYV